jgi:hypothetical protein
MHFKPVHYLDNASDSAGERSSQLLLMTRGYVPAQDDRVSDHFNINQTQCRQATVIDGKAHPTDQSFGICELPIVRIIKSTHASPFPSDRLLQPKMQFGFFTNALRGLKRQGTPSAMKKANVIECPRAFHHFGLLSNEPPGSAGLLFI